MVSSPLMARHGFRHGFSLRTGGVSEPPFDTLNLGRAVGDVPERVAENHRRFVAAVACAEDRLYEVSQVHGAEVVRVDGRVAPAAFRSVTADGLLAGPRPSAADGDWADGDWAVGDWAVGVRVADCVPVLLADPRGGAVAAVHAGWRGVVANIVARAVGAFAELAVGPGDLLVAIGPHIRAEAFEVGDEVADAFRVAVPDPAVIVRAAPGDRARVNLARALRFQLLAAGVDPNHIDDVGGCTYREADRFFSYRRDGAASGRHLAAIATRFSAP